MCLLDAFCSGCDALSDGCCDGAPHPYWKGRPFVQVMCGFLSAMRSFFGKDMPLWSIWAVGTGRLICRSRVSWVPSTVCLIVQCMIEAQRYPKMPKVFIYIYIRYMFGACASNIWRICLTFVQCAFCAWWFWVSYRYIKLNILFSLVPVYAMLWAFRVETIEPYPNIEASALDCRLAIEWHSYTPLAGCGAYGVDV